MHDDNSSAPTPLSRRDFVKNAGAVAGSLSAAAILGCAASGGHAQESQPRSESPKQQAAAVTAPVHVSGSDKLRVGLIGCGGRGSGAATQALTADAGAVLWAMGDAFQDRLDGSLAELNKHAGESEWAADKIQVDPERRFVGFDAYRKVIDSGVDVVILATPPHFRPLHLKAVVEAGKHSFVEKPMSVDGPGVRSILASTEEAKKRNLSLVAGFCWRYGDAERETYKRVNEGAIGKIRAVYTTYNTTQLWRRPRQPAWSDMEFQLRNWVHFIWLSGDHIVEQACHSVDKIAWAMNGELPVRATAVGGRQCRNGPESGNVYDHFSVTFDYDSGARAFHMCRQIDNTASDNTDFIMGERGTCYVNGWGPTHVIKAGKNWEYKIDGPRRNMYQNEHDALFAAIRSGKPINDGLRMSHSTLMSIMARTAAYTGQTVTWDQALNSKQDLSPPKYDWCEMPVAEVPMPGKTVLV